MEAAEPKTDKSGDDPMAIVARFEIPPPPMPHKTDDDVLALFEGPVTALYDQAFFLMKCLEAHREVDPDLRAGLADVCGDTVNAIHNVACVRCISRTPPIIRLGRGNGFDAVLCDECLSETRQ